MTKDRWDREHEPFQDAAEAVEFVTGSPERSAAYVVGLVLMSLAVGVSLIAFLVMMRLIVDPETIPQVDLHVMETVDALLGPRRTALMIRITWLGSALGMTVLTVLLGGVLCARREWRQAAELLLAVLGGAATLFTLKAIFQRARPVEALVEVGGLSFPSGHAFMSIVFFGFVILLVSRHVRSPLAGGVGVIASVGLILLIGLSRIYLGVHFLTDVIGGYAAGFLWLTLVLLLVRLAERQHIRS